MVPELAPSDGGNDLLEGLRRRPYTLFLDRSRRAVRVWKRAGGGGGKREERGERWRGCLGDERRLSNRCDGVGVGVGWTWDLIAAKDHALRGICFQH